MQTLLPSLISSMMLTGVFAYLWWTDRERYLGIWAIAFALWAARYAYGVGVVSEVFPPGDWVLPLLALGRATFILWGACALRGRDLPGWWWWVVVLDLALLLAFETELATFPMREGVVEYLLFGATTIWAGIVFARERRTTGFERVFAGFAMILLGALNMSFPWVRLYPSWFIDVAFAAVNFAQLGIGFAVLLVYFRITRNERARLHHELEERLTRALSGYLPICSHCKSIREEDGGWSGIERYVSERTDAAFSHSICPTCYDEHYAADFGPLPDPTPAGGSRGAA